MGMLTDKEALKKANDELRNAIWLSECGKNAGIRKMNENKCDWLSIVIYLAEQGMRKEDEGK
jgi:hypothetical protein